jgi:hypothetical protein
VPPEEQTQLPLDGYDYGLSSPESSSLFLLLLLLLQEVPPEEQIELQCG